MSYILTVCFAIIPASACLGVQFSSSAATLKLCSRSSVAYSLALTINMSVHFLAVPRQLD